MTIKLFPEIINVWIVPKFKHNRSAKNIVSLDIEFLAIYNYVKDSCVAQKIFVEQKLSKVFIFYSSPKNVESW